MAIVFITEEAQEQFEALPKLIQVRMEKIFVRLRNWPEVSGAKPLRGELGWSVPHSYWRLSNSISGATERL
jgi:hypothetical protein